MEKKNRNGEFRIYRIASNVLRKQFFISRLSCDVCRQENGFDCKKKSLQILLKVYIIIKSYDPEVYINPLITTTLILKVNERWLRFCDLNCHISVVCQNRILIISICFLCVHPEEAAVASSFLNENFQFKRFFDQKASTGNADQNEYHSHVTQRFVKEIMS